MTRHQFALCGIMVLALGLAACVGPAPAARNGNTPVPNIPPAATRAVASPTEQVAASNTPAATAAPMAAQATAVAAASADLTRTDSQGAVEFAVTPLNLSEPGDTLDFDVSMNTHSVNLAWNLAAQSRLTPANRGVPPRRWYADLPHQRRRWHAPVGRGQDTDSDHSECRRSGTHVCLGVDPVVPPPLGTDLLGRDLCFHSQPSQVALWHKREGSVASRPSAAKAPQTCAIWPVLWSAASKQARWR